MNTGKRVLLTGAGFTKNFGGLLANEMWSKIFNHPQVQSQPRVRQLLVNETDYESVFYEILTGDYTPEEKESINSAIFQAYSILDEIVRNWMFNSNSPHPVNIYGVNRMIARFAGSRDEIGFIFTLNQDLFLERHFNDINTIIIHPGMKNVLTHDHIITYLPLKASEFISAPNDSGISKINPLHRSAVNYIKLHGSYGWNSSDGTNMMVIGRNKENMILNEPLLKWYFDHFTSVLSSGKVKILINGYSFRDVHINAVLSKAAKDYGLSLYIISPQSFEDYRDVMRRIEYGELILRSLSGYFPYRLLDLFPSDQSESAAWIELRQRFFD